MFFSKNKKPKVWNKKNILIFTKNLLLGSTTARRMFRLYFLILIIFSCLLFLPISFQNATFENGCYVIQVTENYYDVGPVTNVVKLSFLDILFTAFSAFTDTGMTVAPTATTFSTFGKIMLMFLIQIGGFGIMFFIFLVWKLLLHRDKISINQMLIAQAEKGTTKIGQTSKMLISTSISIIVLEILFGLFYSLWFLYMPAYEQQLVPTSSPEHYFWADTDTYINFYHHPGNAFFAGFFHSVSSINNAGFDIIGSCSLAPYKNGIHTIFLFLTTIQFILGGIGFPILYDLFCKFKIIKKERSLKHKFSFHYFEVKKICTFKIAVNKQYRISLLTKIAVYTTLILSLFSIMMWFLFEATDFGAGHNLLWNDEQTFGTGDIGYYNKSVQIIFQSLSTRSAGFATFPSINLNQSTKWLASFLMFVGGSPSSTAGGIRTTTFALCIIAVFARLIGRSKPGSFKRSFTNKDINQSFIVSFVSMLIVAIGGVIITYINNEDGDIIFTNSIFDSSSAFGTAGLSIGSIYEFDWYGKIYFMFLMFIGQLGVSSTLLALNRNKLKINKFEYPEESIRIG